MHGIQERLDDHPCTNCLLIAQEQGLEVSDGQTYFFGGEDDEELPTGR